MERGQYLRDHFVLSGEALRAFEPAMLKARETRANAHKLHAGRAARTLWPLDGGERWAGVISLMHDTSLHLPDREVNCANGLV